MKCSAQFHRNEDRVTVRADRRIVEGPAYFFASTAKDGPGFIREFFRNGGIRYVALVGNKLTIQKDPETEWGTVLPRLQTALQKHFAPNEVLRMESLVRAV